jgi:hypothetical protein
VAECGHCIVPANNDLPDLLVPVLNLLAAQLCEAHLVENGRLEAAGEAAIHRRPGRLEIFALQHRAGGATVDIDVNAGEGRIQISIGLRFLTGTGLATAIAVRNY